LWKENIENLYDQNKHRLFAMITILFISVYDFDVLSLTGDRKWNSLDRNKTKSNRGTDV